MKIAGFTQLRNELSKGNLENWFKQTSICDYIYIFDQNSDDGSLEYYKQFDNVVVIESPINRFKEELICKQELLTKLLSDHPDVDWILWIDGDLLLDGRLLKNDGAGLKQLCEYGSNRNIDYFRLDHYNLWRSDIHYRVDNQYHSLNGAWVPLWRNNGHLSFPVSQGLHQKQYPDGMKIYAQTPYCVIHRGFATDYQIMAKYDLYKSVGQSGWALDRLLDENGLSVIEISKDFLPDWFNITDSVIPTTKEKIIDIYNKMKHE